MGHSGALIYSCLFLLVIISNLGVQGLSVDDLWDEVGEEIEKIFTQDGIDGARDINFDLGLYGIESGRHVTEGDIKHPKGHYLGGEYTVKKWPNGKIYYALDSRYKGDAWNQIALAMKTLQTYTCLRFVPIDSSTQDYVYFTRAGGCHSMLGKVGGKQIISLDVGCLDVGTIIHELMHAAGFIHEHARQDRDDYVRIVWSNIKEGLASQFEKESGVLHHSHTPYDYSSIMHYRRNSFSNNGQATIEPKHSREATHMGQNEGPTELDIRKINLAYGCQRKQTKTPTLPEPTQEVAACCGFEAKLWTFIG
ncbi:hypothetical protein L596_027380 [Steinernema carpocapsae]|uniref:Metalloendopeptidase n=1 Tax=Steinernema carpocapsae TaxID=34508 RepID=A0A4U5M465_STECR|nr:hypothetical protein L596_027380 [Steinernema carpocapsae]